MADPLPNAYLAMSELAGRENWCWKLSCTTCGCHHFREGLACLSLGLHPQEADWPIRRKSTRVPRVLQGMDWRRLDAEAGLRVTRIAAEVNLGDLADRVRFPDWMGHLGVVLDACREAERDEPVLSRSIVRQAAERFGPEIFEGRDPDDTAMSPLNPIELERIERAWIMR